MDSQAKALEIRVRTVSALGDQVSQQWHSFREGTLRKDIQGHTIDPFFFSDTGKKILSNQSTIVFSATNPLHVFLGANVYVCILSEILSYTASPVLTLSLFIQ